MSDWKPLLDAIREECPVGLWSKGVELARAGAVTGAERDGDEWAFRVKAPGRPIPPTVRLYPNDAEWDCDCGTRFGACDHVAAATMALMRSTGAADPTLEKETTSGATLRYELHTHRSGLKVDRVQVAADGSTSPLGGVLTDLIARNSPSLKVTPTHADVAIDRLLGRKAGQPITFEKSEKLLRALVQVADIRLDGDKVRASSEPCHPEARVVDAKGGGVELIVDLPPGATQVAGPGLVRIGDTLHPFGTEDRFGKKWDDLPLRRTFSRARIPNLVGTVLPELARHISIDIRTNRLPKTDDTAAPWIRFEIDVIEGGIDALPLLVYGDPPCARVDSNRLVHLRGALPERQPKIERELVSRLRDELNMVPGRRVNFPGAVGAKILSKIESFDDGRPKDSKLSLHNDRPSLTPRVEVDGDRLEIIFEVTTSSPLSPLMTPGEESGDENRGTPTGTFASAEDVVSAWRGGTGLVPLSDGSFARVPTGWLDRHGDLVADLLSARALNQGNTPKSAIGIVAELCEALEAPEPLGLKRLTALLEAVPPASGSGKQDDANAKAGKAGRVEPKDFVGELRDYQRAGAAWLIRLRDAQLGAVLADDMGLGKTVQALCALEGHCLVVCPRSVIHNWARETERFRPSASVHLYHGPKRKLPDPAAIKKGATSITLTTYATLRNDIEKLIGVRWSSVVLDEAQAIKNPSSQTARAAYRLDADFRISLSGTPVENRLDELWSQMHFVNRGLLGGRSDFANRFERPIVDGSEDAAELLRKRLRPFLLRRLKSEVAKELPPRTEATLFCELSSKERVSYDAVRVAARADVAKKVAAGTNVMAALETLLRLRQAACHSDLLPGIEAASSSKVEALIERLEDAVADGHKALVFSQWTGFLDRIEPHLTKENIAFGRLDGSTKDRAAVVDAFQAEDGPPVLLISLTAGGTGVNLVAADHVFLLDPWWNPAVEDQAADRAHRIGQDKPVMVYRLVAKDTVEEKVLELQQRKRQIAATALSAAEAAGATAITRDEIMALLD